MKALPSLLGVLALSTLTVHAQSGQDTKQKENIKAFFTTMADAANGFNEGKTQLAGGRGGEPFSDTQKEGAILVGFEVWSGPAEIKGIQPIFETETGRVRGQKHGNCSGQSVTLEAKDGYAVAGLLANGTNVTVGFQLEYMKIYHSGKSLDAVGVYKSDWVGQAKMGKSYRLIPNQKPIIGIYGGASGSLNSLGLLYFDRK